MKDRRIFTRIKVRLPMKFLDPSCGKEGAGETVNVSAIGVGFISNETMYPTTGLEMWIMIPDRQEPLHVTGEVVWSKKMDDTNAQRVGVYLENQELIELGRVIKYKDSA